MRGKSSGVVRGFTYKSKRNRLPAMAAGLLLPLCVAGAQAQQAPQSPQPQQPWMNTQLSPDERADLVLQQLSLDDKIQLLHGTDNEHGAPPNPHAVDANGGAGYTPGFPKLSIPGLQMADSAYGVALSAQNGRYSTALPSTLGEAASWNPEVAFQYGALIGRELRDQGYTMSLGGGVDLAREPRDGRTFEYQGEDPLLAGTMVGHLIRGVQSQHIVGDIKHYALNDQESGRHAVNAVIGERAMRESDLLAFQVGIATGHPGAVMCGYNRVNGDYDCENDFLLRTVLKGDWKFPGFVVSDWTATHSTEKASHAGLDNEQPSDIFYGAAFQKAVVDGKISQAELDDHVHRILRAEFASGLVDDPPKKNVVDVMRGMKIARELEEKSIVLLRNQNGVLPLDRTKLKTIAVIGQYADLGMISGAGSAQVDPPGGNAIAKAPHPGLPEEKGLWFPDAPLAAVKQAAPGVRVVFANGMDAAQSAAVAKGADVALVFVHQWEGEGIDLPTLALGNKQNELVDAVAAANPHTVVVLENGSPVLMPWVDKVTGVLETWYSGSDGANAIAAVLFGDVNPSGKLPITFPVSDADLPHPKLIEPPPTSQEDWHDEDAMTRKLEEGLPPFDTQYTEGLEVGYKWYDAQRKPVLFPFGFGLSYTTFAYSGLQVMQGTGTTVHLTVRNIGTRAGDEIAEVYSTLPDAAGEPPKRLVGWAHVSLKPGESQQVEIVIPMERFTIWNETTHAWKVVPGNYTIMAGPSSAELPLKQTVHL